jgi:aminoglycoside phosphotransferase (APT) family kinase protein
MNDGDDPRLEPPDAATLAWAARQLASPAVVVVRRLGGGLDAATHLVRSDIGTEVVLRRATRPHQELPGEDLRKERDQLSLLQNSGLPVARPLGADLHAVHTDVPALLVSRLPGLLTYPQEPTAAFISGVAQAAALVHGQPVPDLTWPWNDRAANLQRVVDAGKTQDWARLRDVGLPEGPLTFVHGDLWPGNLLFNGDRLTGIVDWGDAGVGHPALEVTYMAADLRVATGSQDIHEAVIDAYEAIRGPLPNRAWWEVAGYLRFPTDPAYWLAGWTEAGLSLSAADVRARHAAGLTHARNRLG